MPSHTAATLIPLSLVKQAFAPTWPLAFKQPDLPVKAKDILHGGTGRVAGTVKVKGTPDYAVYRKVWLIDEHDGTLVREVWSDPVTGAYAFDNVSRDHKYTVLTYDYAHNFRAVVADNLTAEAM